MKQELTSPELVFALRLHIAIGKGQDVSNLTKIGYLTNYSAAAAKKLLSALHRKEVIVLKTTKGRNGNTSVTFLIDPSTLIDINI